MKTAVITAASTDQMPYAQFTLPIMREYAAGIKAEFHIIRDALPGLRGWFCKMRLFDYLGYFDRIIFMDSDVLVSKHCPNFLDVVPADKLGAWLEVGINDGLIVERLEHLERIYGPMPAEAHLRFLQGYFATGLLVVSTMHRDVFKYDLGDLLDRVQRMHDNGYDGRGGDQDFMNYNAHMAGFKLHPLTVKDHCFVWSPLRHINRFESYTIHYGDNKKIMIPFDIVVMQEYQHKQVQEKTHDASL